MSRAAFGAALALLSVAPASAQDVKWVSLYADRDAETLYDPASLKRVGNRVTLSLRSVAKGADWSAIMKMEIDCRAQTMAMLSGEEFGAEGKQLRSRIIEPGKIERMPMFKGEDMEPVYKVACPKGAPLPGMSGPPIIVSPRTN